MQNLPWIQMLWTWLTQSRLRLCRSVSVCVDACVRARLLLCMCVSIQQQQLHSISLLRQRSRRSSGSNTHTNLTQRCVGGHFEPMVSRAWAATEKMSRHHFRGGPRYTWGPLAGSRRLALLCWSYCTKNSKSQQAASAADRWSRKRAKTHEGRGKP